MNPLDRIADRLQGFAAFQDRPGAMAELEAIAAELRGLRLIDDTESDQICGEYEGATGIRCNQNIGHPPPRTGTDGDPGDEHSIAITWPRLAASGLHSGRSFRGTDLEETCPCPKEPCGLVDVALAHPDCPEHPTKRAKTMRQNHTADRCPARKEPAQP